MWIIHPENHRENARLYETMIVNVRGHFQFTCFTFAPYSYCHCIQSHLLFLFMLDASVSLFSSLYFFLHIFKLSLVLFLLSYFLFPFITDHISVILFFYGHFFHTFLNPTTPRSPSSFFLLLLAVVSFFFSFRCLVFILLWYKPTIFFYNYTSQFLLLH